MAGVPPIWPDHRVPPAGLVPDPGEEEVRSPAWCGPPRRPIPRLRARPRARSVVPELTDAGTGSGQTGALPRAVVVEAYPPPGLGARPPHLLKS